MFGITSSSRPQSMLERRAGQTTLAAHRKELVEPLIAEYQGRVVKLMGDGALVEFASVDDAVRCAVLIQRGWPSARRGCPKIGASACASASTSAT